MSLSSGTPVPSLRVRGTRVADIGPIISLCRATYPDSWPWYSAQIESDLAVFPEGQLVVEDPAVLDAGTPRIIAMAASLILRWADYAVDARWGELTDHGHFSNHDPEHGDTLYGAEIMVHPEYQGRGVGTLLYQARDQIAQTYKLGAIRAGARLAGYAKYLATQPVDRSAQAYIEQVVRGQIFDPTVSFQLRRGFRVITVVPRYFSDPDSLGWAAVIEKLLS